jgi:hypothetical protein
MKARMTRWTGLLGACIAIAACGGVVKTGEPVPGSSSDPPSSSGGASGTKPKGDPPPTVDLPPCKLGFDPTDQPEKPCPYTVDGRCYAEKLDACGCACKGQSGLTCVSGFPELDGTTEVTCS